VDITKTGHYTIPYEQALQKAREFEQQENLGRAAGNYSSAGEAAYRKGLYFTSYRCYNKASKLTDQLVRERGYDKSLIMDSIHQHVFAGRNAITIHNKRADKLKTAEERELWWERAAGHFANAKAGLMTLLDAGVDVAKIRGLFTQSLELLEDPEVVKMLSRDRKGAQTQTTVKT
jgi:hypothetical protein